MFSVLSYVYLTISAKGGYHRRKLRNRIFEISESINSKHTNSVMNEFCLKLLVKWNLIKCFVSHLLQLLTTAEAERKKKTSPFDKSSSSLQI